MTEALTKQAGLCPSVLVTFGLYSLIPMRFLMGELGMRKVLLDEVAELGVNRVFPNGCPILLEIAGPKMDWFAPAGVEG